MFDEFRNQCLMKAVDLAQRLEFGTLLMVLVHPSNIPRKPEMCPYIFALSYSLEDFNEKDSYDTYLELLKDAKCLDDFDKAVKGDPKLELNELIQLFIKAKDIEKLNYFLIVQDAEIAITNNLVLGLPEDPQVSELSRMYYILTALFE